MLTPAQEIEYNFLLANLREAEGLWYDLVAECYARAATKLAVQQGKYDEKPNTQGIIFLEAARCIEAWSQRALELEEKYYGPGHDRVRKGKRSWDETLARMPFMQILRMTVSSSKSGCLLCGEPANGVGQELMKDRGEYSPSSCGEDFAMHVNEANLTMTSLSQNYTANMIWRRLRKQ